MRVDSIRTETVRYSRGSAVVRTVRRLFIPSPGAVARGRAGAGEALREPPPRAVRLLERVGNTPLVPLPRIGRAVSPVELYAKAEWFNPGGSAKDRAALWMIEHAERQGALTPGKTILDATSGNTGIAYAWIGAALGYPVRLALPASASRERQRILRAYGAELELTDALEGSDGAIREARRLHRQDPERYFYPDQYANPLNWTAHYETTGPEIWEQSGGRVTDFVCGLGTTGTFVGTARRLRELAPHVRLISMQPDSPLHAMEGLKHLPTALVPPIYDPSLAHEEETVTTEEAYVMVRRLAREEGLLVGVSSGAALAAALRVAARRRRGVVVTVFPDGGDRYLGERVWDPDGAHEVRA